MALYDIECSDCGVVQEVMCSWKEIDNYQFKCEECGSSNGKRLLSKPAIVFNSPDNNVFKNGGVLTTMDTLNGRPRKSKKVYSGSPSDSTPK